MVKPIDPSDATDIVVSSRSTDDSLSAPSAPAISRGALLKGAAVTAAGVALMTPAARALAASSPVAVPSVVGGAPQGAITIWDRAGDLFQVFDATIPSFNKKYPGVKVNHVAVDVDAKLPTTLATGVNVPDGSFYEDANLPVQAGHFYDLTDLMKPYIKGVVPFKVQVNTHNGRILGVPWDLDPGLLYYREDLLHQAGVDPLSITTYDELFTAGQTLQKKLGPSVKPIHVEQDPGLAQLWVEMFANQQGVSMVDASGKLQINSAPYLKILQWIKRVNDAGLGTRAVYYSPGDIKAIEAGQVALYPWAIWASYGPQFLFKRSKGLWRAMPLPAWTKGGARGAVMGGSSFIIPNKAANPHLAWLWYEHLVFSREGYHAVYGPNKIYPGGLSTSLPSYTPALSEQLFQNPAGLGGQNLWQVATSTVKQIPGTYYYPTWYNQAIPYFGANIQRLLDGKLTPQQVLTQSASDIQTKLINRA